jgi:ATP/maltotriose-dependent transcriptional regulator MalT
LLLNRLAALAELGRRGEAAALAEQALTQLGGQHGSDYLVALSCSAQLADAEGRFSDVASIIEEQLQLAEQMPPASQLFVYGSAAAYLATHGLVDRAETMRKQAEALYHDGSLLVDERLDLAAAYIDFFRGEWDAALARTARQRGLPGETRRVASLPYFELIDVTIRSSRGDLATARGMAELIAAADGAPRFRAVQRCARGWIDLVDQRPVAAAEEFDAGLLHASGAMRPLLLAYAARARHLADDQPAALVHLAEAEEADLCGAAPFVEVERLLARAEVMADPGAARDAYEAAEVFSLAFLAAQALLLRGQLGDEPQDALPDAWRRFRRLGADIWRGRAAAALRVRRLPVPRAPRRRPDRLSEIEKEIVGLVHEGLSNQEIAERLSYSKHTINAYLTRIYARTGYSSRFDLVRAVASGVDL